MRPAARPWSFRRAAVVATLALTAVATAPLHAQEGGGESAKPGVLQRTGHAVAHGAEVAGSAVVHGANLAGHAVAHGAKVAASAVGKGAEKTGQVIEKGAHKVGLKTTAPKDQMAPHGEQPKAPGEH